MQTIITRQQSKAIDAAAPLTGHSDLFILELPAVRNAWQERHAAFVAVEHIDMVLLKECLELSQDFTLELVDVGIGRLLYGSSNALEAATVFLRNRVKV